MLVLGHDDSNTGTIKRGSEQTDVEVHGPNSLPLSDDGLKIVASRQAIATRKAKAAVTLRRTCPAASR
jgi:hypothetical protein